MFEPVGFIAGFDDVAVMRDAVEHGGRHLGIGKDLHPFREGQIGVRNKRSCPPARQSVLDSAQAVAARQTFILPSSPLQATRPNKLAPNNTMVNSDFL